MSHSSKYILRIWGNITSFSEVCINEPLPSLFLHLFVQKTWCRGGANFRRTTALVNTTRPATLLLPVVFRLVYNTKHPVRWCLIKWTHCGERLIQENKSTCKVCSYVYTLPWLSYLTRREAVFGSAHNWNCSWTFPTLTMWQHCCDQCLLAKFFFKAIFSLVGSIWLRSATEFRNSEISNRR